MEVERTGRDTLDTATTCETTDGWLGDALDVVTENLAVTLGSALSKTLSSLSACVVLVVVTWSDVMMLWMLGVEQVASMRLMCNNTPRSLPQLPQQYRRSCCREEMILTSSHID